MSSAITPWLYPAWLLPQLLSSLYPGSVWSQQQQVVLQLRPCRQDGTGQDKAPSMSAGSHLLCSPLWRLFFTSLVPFHIAPVGSSLFPPSLLPAGHHSLLSALFSLAGHTAHPPRLRRSRAREQPVSYHQPKLSAAPRHQRSPSCSLPGSGLGPQASVHRWPKMLLLVDSGCVSGACGMYQVPPCGDTENGLLHRGRGSISKPPPLPYIRFSGTLYFPPRVLERSCRVRGDLEFSYGRSSPQVPCCCHPSNHC